MNPNNAVQHDERGRAYVMANGPNGLQRQYLTSVEDARKYGSNGLITNKEFNADTGDWDTEINWGNIIGLGAGGVAGGAGIAGAMPAATVGGATTGSTAAGTTAAHGGVMASAFGTGGYGGAAINTGGQVFSTIYQGKKNDEATKVAADSSKYATDAQTKTNDALLKFQQDQAKLDAARQETNRRADYEQWAAREHRVGSIGEMLGLPSRQVPDYVPQDAAPPGSIAGSQPSGSRGTAPAQGEVDWTAPPDQLSSQLTAYFQKRGVAPSETPYGVSKAQELVARGKELGDPSYADKRLAAANVFGGGSSSGKSSTAPPGSILGTTPVSTLTPQYIAPRVVPGSIRSFAA